MKIYKAPQIRQKDLDLEKDFLASVSTGEGLSGKDTYDYEWEEVN